MSTTKPELLAVSELSAPPELLALPELLAPAGDHDSLLAALSAGADAVYLGVEDYNARRNAANFTLDGLPKVCDLVHISGKRVYLTLNTMIRPDEMTQAVQVAKSAWQAGVDALIVQDFGLLERLAVELPGFELHTSTQMNIHSAEGVRLAAKLGATRVTLARELSLDELGEIAAEGVALEVFAHGALCVCYSGQCLFSSLVGRRSANRGLCAQACRLPYQLIDTSTGRRIKTPGDHLLSPADLATIDILPALCATGVASLKIEGRMKSATYVATVTRAYREALDSLAGGAGGSRKMTGDPCAATGDPCETLNDATVATSDLAETFSRGFTTAYFEGERGNAMMSYSRPNNQGVAVGRVSALGGSVAGGAGSGGAAAKNAATRSAATKKGLVTIALTKRVSRKDVLEIRTSRGQTIVKLDEFWDADTANKAPLSDADAGSQIRLQIDDPVTIGDRVFRVRNAELLDKAESTFDNTVFQGNNGLVALEATVKAQLGQPLEIGFALNRDGQSVYETALGAPVEAALTKALTTADIVEHVGRIGGTAFTITGWDIQLDESVGMGFAALHALRKAALDNLTARLLAPWRNRRLSAIDEPTALAPARKGSPRVAAIVKDIAGAKAAIQGGAQLIYLHALSFEAKDEVAEQAESPQSNQVKPPRGNQANPLQSSQIKGVPVILYLPTISHDNDLVNLTETLEGSASAVANNLGEIAAFSTTVANLEAGPSLSICNNPAIDLLARQGLTQAWLSPELSLQDISIISPGATLPLALTVFGAQEVMVLEHCVLMAQGPCDQRCASCSRRKAPRLLEDRKGYRFPVRTDNRGRSHLFNSVQLDLIPSMPELVSLGISTLVVDGSLLTTKDLRAEVERTVRARDLAVKGAGSLPKREGYTTGHFFRGVL